MRITINLATKPFADLGPALKRLRIAMGVLALVAIGFGFGLHALSSRANAARAKEHSLDGSIAQVRQERQGYQSLMKQPENAQVLDQSEALNDLIDVKAFSWTLAMEDLETVLPGGVQVTTLEPTVDKKDRHITVRMRVVGPRNKAVELVQNLEHSKRFLLPRITGETMENAGNGTQQIEPVSATNRVNFDLLADYNPAAPGDRKASKKAKAEGETAAPTPSPARVGVPSRGRMMVPPRGAMPNQSPLRQITPRPVAPRQGVPMQQNQQPVQQVNPQRPPYVDQPRPVPPNPFPQGGAR